MKKRGLLIGVLFIILIINLGLINAQTSECNDGIDNDIDGEVDYAGGPLEEPADTDCWGNPDDNSEDVLEICTGQDLDNVRNGLIGKNYIQVCDIDLTGQEWIPLGSDASGFKGKFDGNGFKITGLTITTYVGDDVGLFGFVDADNAELKGIVLEGVNIDVIGSNVGGLVGRLGYTGITGIVLNSHVTGSVNGLDNVGGLVGYSKSSIVNGSSSKGSVRGTNYVGGLVGYVEGFNVGNTISESSSESSIVGTNSVGGLVGYAYWDFLIERSFAKGDVLGLGENIGGLLGEVDGTAGRGISNSYASGDVNGLTKVGGLVGYVPTVDRLDVTNSYSIGGVSGSFSGGFIGSHLGHGTIINSYFDLDTSGQTEACSIGSRDCTGVTGKTTIQMKQQNTYSGWPFGSVWMIINGETYPWLDWEGINDISCSTDDQVILSLSSPTNAHAEIFGQDNYLVDVCYDDVFGSSFDVTGWGQDPRDCLLENNGDILRLSGDTNAHGEILEEATAGYQDVCYGDLVCESIEMPGECDIANEQFEIVSLSGNTNAHLEKEDANGFNSGYRVCCFSPSAGAPIGEINIVEWRNLAGNKIGSDVGINATVNSTVKLFADTTFDEGRVVTFDIDERDLAFHDDIVELDGIVDINGDVEIEWFVDDNAMEACGIGILEGEFCEFFFTAIVLDKSLESDELLVNNTEANTPPDAHIVSPVHRGIYFTDVPILFNHSSFDAEGNIVSFTWTVYKDNVFEFENNQETFYHTFTDGAQRTITLTVEDESGMKDEDQVAIVVTESPGMLAYINVPRHLQVVMNETLTFAYNSNDSYVINTEIIGLINDPNCGYEITCEGGYCPDKTENVPINCNEQFLIVDPPLDVGFLTLNFGWKFHDERMEKEFQEQGRVKGKDVFGIASSHLNDKSIDLLFNITNDEKGIYMERPATREFTLVDQRQCINGGELWLELSDEGLILDTYETSSSDACKGKDGVIGSNDDCCPALQRCTSDGCRGDEGSNITSCGDYETENNCDADEYGIGRLPEPVDLMWDTLYCGGMDDKGRIVQCSCEWDGPANNKLCALTPTYYNGTGGGDETCIENQCMYYYEEGECSDGFMELTVNTHYIGGTCGNDELGRNECTEGAGVFIVPCGRPTIELPFFGKWQFIGAAILIMLVYFVMKGMNEGKRKKKGKR